MVSHCCNIYTVKLREMFYRTLTVAMKFNDLTTGWMVQGSIPGKVRDLYVLHNVQMGSGTNPSSRSIGTRGYLRVGKAAGS
jgi:hypothetical protein